ncbi:MAG: hypothetical protein EPN99_12390, partial [Frankiales bacterium]
MSDVRMLSVEPPHVEPLVRHGYGPLGRLGLWTSAHLRIVLIAWAVVAVGLGAFAPKVEHALAGAGWEASGSESVQTRELV